MKALVLLGCPEAPSQTPIGLYASYKLGQMGYDVTVSSNPAAGKILDISDPEGIYVKKRVDIEKCLDEIEEGDYDLLVGCVHKDAAATFFITYYHILKCKALALVFSRDAEEVAEFAEMVESSTDADIIAVRAFHNPNPIKVRFDKYLKTLEEE